MNTFIPVILACLAGPALQLAVALAVRAAGGVERITDSVCLALGIVALVLVCMISTPAVWEITFLFAYLWPVAFRLILRVAERPAR